MLREISVNRFALRRREPAESRFEYFLTLGITLHIRGPLLLIRVVGVGELSLRRRNERPRVDRVEQFLRVQGDSRDIDGAEPLLNLSLGALALVDQKRAVQELILVVLRQRREGLLSAVDRDGEVVGAVV